MTAAIYCRLSREDEEKQSESESIQNQKSMLIKYALDKGWDIYNIYCDEDYSGIDRERPAFRQLIADAEARRFDIVLVKTQSRFTRDMELVEKYIHGLFAEWGIRFVATVDNVDTDIKGNKKARQINGLVNEWYLEDLSENIRTVFDYKRRAGQYIGGFPLYGYRKDPADKNKLIVEPQAAAVVRRIYALYLAGHGTQSIAAILNRDGVPNPTRHKQAMGYPYRNGAAHNDHGLWNRTTVSRILRDQMYTGDLVQGRTKKSAINPKRWLLYRSAIGSLCQIPMSRSSAAERSSAYRKCCMRAHAPRGWERCIHWRGKSIVCSAAARCSATATAGLPANILISGASCMRRTSLCAQIITSAWTGWRRRCCAGCNVI